MSLTVRNDFFTCLAILLTQTQGPMLVSVVIPILTVVLLGPGLLLEYFCLAWHPHLPRPAHHYAKGMRFMSTSSSVPSGKASGLGILGITGLNSRVLRRKKYGFGDPYSDPQFSFL